MLLLLTLHYYLIQNEVLHDSDLMRVAGLNKQIWEISYDEIKTLDAGSWFSEEFRGERIPTLAETIETARGRIKLNIELKFNGHEQSLSQRVIRIVREHGFENECIVTTLDYDRLMEVRHP